MLERTDGDRQMCTKFRKECGAEGSVRGWVASLTDDERFELCVFWAQAEARDIVRCTTLRRERASWGGGEQEITHAPRDRRRKDAEERKEADEEEKRARASRLSSFHEAAGSGAAQAKAQLSAARRLADSASEGFADSVRIEWHDPELLEAKIARPDGSYTTWGNASREDHRARIEMFRVNATANIEGAGRHIAALRDLEESGSETLNEMVGVAHV